MMDDCILLDFTLYFLITSSRCEISLGPDVCNKVPALTTASNVDMYDDNQDKGDTFKFTATLSDVGGAIVLKRN